MSATATVANHSYQNGPQEEYARWRRRDHDNIEAMQNLIIAEAAERAGVEMPAQVRQLLSAIQGAHGGGEVVNDEFRRSYLGIGRQLHFTGTETAIKSRVRARINALLWWQDGCGLTLVTVRKGGSVKGYDERGEPIYECSTFIDHLLPVADEAVQRARKSATWKTHPGDALAEQVTEAIKKMPSYQPVTPPDGAPAKTSQSLPVDEYEKRQERRIREMLEAAVEGVEERGGDGVLWARRKLIEQLKKTVDSLEKTYPARRSWIMPGDDDEDESPAVALDEVATVNGNAYRGKDFAASASANETEKQGGGTENLTPPCDDKPSMGKVFRTPSCGDKPSMGKENLTHAIAESSPNTMKPAEAALHYAAIGLPVFPVKPDKSPATPRGFKDATTDVALIRRWYAAHPEYGIGIPTGKASGWLVLDSDPRHGGDATLTALIEQHGDLPETLRAHTGGGGDHFVFAYPDDIEIRNSAGKLGAGLDIRGAGGYIIVAPSSHPSGGIYAWANAYHPACAPAWMLEALRAKTHQPIDTDYNPTLRPPRSFGVVFSEGQRNDGLFKVACGIWGSGGADTMLDLHRQLLEINYQRCVPPLPDGEVAHMAAHVVTDYPRGLPK